MKQLLLFMVLASCFLACKKMPERQAIEIELTAINGEYQQPLFGSYTVAYEPEYELAFSYESNAGIDSVHIRQLLNVLNRIEGVDEERIDHIPEMGSKKGSFVYTLNTAEQTDDNGPGGEETKVSIKIVMLNELGVIGEKLINLKIQ